MSQSTHTSDTAKSEAEAVYLPKKELLNLDGKTINKEQTDEGRIKETYWKVIDTADNVVLMQGGDRIIFIDSHNSTDDRRIRSVEKVSSDISNTGGIHALLAEEDEDNPSPLRLNLIRDYLENRELLIIGTRTCEYADREQFN